MRVLFVCLGNICRSPTAEGVMRHLLAEQGLGAEIELDSAGTGGWHVGEPPDSRAREAAARRGIVLEGSARRLAADDLDGHDLVLAMDRENLREIERVAAHLGHPPRARLGLLREFDPLAVERGELDVPDPYYGADGGFAEVLDIVERACRGLIGRIRPAAQ